MPSGDSGAQADLAEPADPAPTDVSGAAAPPVADTGRARRSRPAAPGAISAEDSLKAEPRPAPRKRSRRVTAVQSAPVAAPPPEATVPPPAPPPAAAPHPAPATTGRAAGPAAEPAASDALVRDTILHAEEEARLIVEDARERIAAVGARTRALLEQSLGDTARPPARRVRQPVRPGPSVDERAYQGAVTVEAGPFDDVAQLKAFEDALASIPGVEEVYIRTFERYYAHFALRVSEPTRLIAELRIRTADPLRVIDSTGEDPRLEIIRDGGAAG